MHPWLAVVAITMMPIKKRTMNARWARSLGKRILKYYSGAVLPKGSRPVIPESRSEYISTGAGQYSAWSGGKHLIVIRRFRSPRVRRPVTPYGMAIPWVGQAWGGLWDCDNIRPSLFRKST